MGGYFSKDYIYKGHRWSIFKARMRRCGVGLAVAPFRWRLRFFRCGPDRKLVVGPFVILWSW